VIVSGSACCLARVLAKAQNFLALAAPKACPPKEIKSERETHCAGDSEAYRPFPAVPLPPM